MKVLLVVPPEVHYIEASANERVDKKREPRPKLGILYVATYLNKHQPDVELKVLDCPAEGIGFEEYGEFVKSFSPDLIGITALTFTIVDALEIVKISRIKSPRSRVCIGGYHSTLFPEETLGQPGVDFVVFGEGEITFDELVREIGKDKPSFETISGLGYREGQKLIINAPRPLVEDLDILPFPDYDLVDINKYAHVLGKSRITISIQTSRGCPFSCIFCDIRRTKFRFRSAKSIVGEIMHWYKEGIRSFFIVDDNFVIRRERLMDICSQIRENNLDIDIKISARVDSIEREMLKALKEAGCSRINLGVETGHKKYLDYLEKGITPEQTRRAFDLCHESGIEAFAYMMIGLPNETKQEMYEELDFLKSIKADYASFAVCSPYPKTRLYEKLLEEKIVVHDYWREFVQSPGEDFIMPLVPSQYSPEELRHIQSDITRKFYMSWRFIVRKLKSITSIKQFVNIVRLGIKIVRP